MGRLVEAQIFCKKCKGDLVVKYIFLNNLCEAWEKKQEYELITECPICNKRQNFRFPFNVSFDSGGKDEKEK